MVRSLFFWAWLGAAGFASSLTVRVPSVPAAPERAPEPGPICPELFAGCEAVA